MTQTFLAFLILFSFSAFAEKVEPKPGDRCFKFTPQSPIDDKKCSPVKTKIEFFDCQTQAPQEAVDDVSAKFECKRNPKRLKYWHKDTMLFANVEKKNGAYEVTQTSSLVYSTKDPSTAVVAPPSAVKEVADVGNLHPVAFVPSGLPAPSPLPSPTPEVLPQPTTVVPPPPVVKESLPAPLNEVKIYGLADAYYLYNMNLPSPVSTTAAVPTTTPNENVIFLTKMYHDQITANMAMLGVSKKAEPIGFKLELAYGPQAARFLEVNGGSSLFALSQAVLTYKTPFDLTIELGKFHSPTGFESFYATENMLYTLSLGKQWVLPSWHQGIKMTMPFFNESLFFSFYVVNGSNTMYENNASKSFGGQLRFAPSESVELVANMVGGNETPQGGADIRSTIEGIAAFKFSVMRLAVDFSTSQESVSGNTPARNSSLAAYLGYQVAGPWSLLARYEMYSDDAVYSAGLRSYPVATAVPAQAISVNSISGAIEFAASKDLKFKAEYRTDTSSLNSYTDNLGNAVAIQNLGVIAGVLSF